MLRPYRLINRVISNPKSIVPGIGKLEMAMLRGICLGSKSLQKSETFKCYTLQVSTRKKRYTTTTTDDDETNPNMDKQADVLRGHLG
jgi:hypothetical protein